jgi:hypothetical protein
MNKHCLREPIPEILTAAKLLSEAAEAHLAGNRDEAEQLIVATNTPVIRAWTESLWGAGSPYVTVNSLAATATVTLARSPMRMPSAIEKAALIKRDGYHCRFCGIPVIRKEVRVLLNRIYPKALPWGKANELQHAAFQAMWLQYDHLVPHSKGGDNSQENMVITCAPCNFSRMSHTLEEVGLSNPLLREPVTSNWDGLERIVMRSALSNALRIYNAP